MSRLSPQHGYKGKHPIVFVFVVVIVHNGNSKLKFFHLILLKAFQYQIFTLKDFETRP